MISGSWAITPNCYNLFMAKLAVYTIALNEAKHVERWLEATKDFDVRLVADTGSTDGTPEMLAAAGVIVHRITVFPWRFDVARNTALSLVPADVDFCLALDMDETTGPDLYEKLRNLPTGSIDKVRIWHNTGNRWRCDRVHSRNGWRWVSPCHEVTMWYGEGEPRIVNIDADIYHLPDNTKPRSQYLPLLEMAVREAPNDGRMWTYLAREYYFAGDKDSLLDVAEDAIKRNPWWPEQAAVAVWAGRMTDEVAWFEHATRLNAEEAEPWHELAAYHYRHQNWTDCSIAAEAGVVCDPTTHYLRDESVLQWRLFDLLAISAWHRGFPADALYWAEKALVGNPDDERLQQNVAFFKGKLNDETPKGNASNVR